MKKSRFIRFCVLLGIGAWLGFVASAADLNFITARIVAKNFIEKDGVGSSLLIGCSVKDATARGGLWAVTLKPSGYILLSGNTAAEPVVAFSRNDFVEPEAGTAFAEMIESAQTNAAVAKAKAAVASVNSGVMSVSLASAADLTSVVSERREAKWDLLLGKGGISSLFNGGISTASVTYDEASLTKSVLPLLETEWSQWQPYNDYTPIDESASAEGAYRGRYACGCVATAYAQVMKYWEWPVRMDEVFSAAHDMYDSSWNLTGTQMVRFDGHEAFDWASMANEYDYYSRNTYDMRGVTAESARHSVARLVSMAAVMAEMYYQSSGSGSNVGMIIKKNPWYEAGTTLTRTTVNDDETFFAAVKASLEEGVPVLVTVPGHQVIGHGWAEGSDGTGYVYLNYGWGGSSDGYYNITEETVDTYKGYIQGAVVGHRPKRTVQIDELAAVSEESVTLKWHVPERYAADFTGYEIVVGKASENVSNWSCDFEDTSVDYGGFTSGMISDIGNETRVISILTGKAATYEFPEVFRLTGHSMLTYFLRSYYASGLTLKIQGRLDGGEWVDLDTPTLATYSIPSSLTRQVFLGGKGGQTLRLRIVVTTTGTYYPSADSTFGIQLDDFRLTEVLALEEETVTCEASARSHTFTGLTPGATYLFAVKPVGEGTLLSSAVQTTIEGVAKVPKAGGYALGDYVFTAGDENWGVATSNGSSLDGSSVSFGCWDGALSISSDNELTKDSVFSFDWTAKGYYEEGEAYDVLSVTFTPLGGESVTLLSQTNTVNQTTGQHVEISLSAYAGKKGTIAVSYVHNGLQYTYSGYGLTISNAKLTNVLKPDVNGEIEYQEVVWTASELPRILSVTSVNENSVAVQEGFYRECARGGNVFFVNCSAGVTNLVAHPSHQYLLTEENVTVASLGRGKFAVTVDGSGIGDAEDRTRMILTLEATDESGSKAYKDLSLRFSSETEGESYTPSAADFMTTTVIPVPYTWLVEKGLAVIDESLSAEELAKVMNEAAAADFDGDGFVNYAEYLCGTDPKDGEDYLKASIEMVDGKPVISWNDGLSEDAEYTVIGAPTLSTEGWEKVDDSNLSKMRFFRVKATMK